MLINHVFGGGVSVYVVILGGACTYVHTYLYTEQADIYTICSNVMQCNL